MGGLAVWHIGSMVVYSYKQLWGIWEYWQLGNWAYWHTGSLFI